MTKPGGRIRWLHRSSLAIFDQAIFAGASFVLNVILARQMAPSEYGAFTFSYSVFLFWGSLHIAFLADPAVVFGAGRYGLWFSVYVGSLIRLHLTISLAGSAILALAGLVSIHFNASVGYGVVGAAIAAPFVLLSWLLRRAIYVQSDLRWSIAAGIVYLALIAGGLWYGHVRSGFGAMIVLGVAALFAVVVLLRALTPSMQPLPGAPSDSDVRRQHWKFAHWSVPTAALLWLIDNSFYVILPFFHGLRTSGDLRIVTILGLPVVNAVGILAMSLLPSLSRAHTGGEGKRFRSLVRRAVLALMGCCVLYGVLLVAFGPALIRLLFGSSYVPARLALVLTALLPIPIALYGVFSHALRAAERFRAVFWYVLAGAAIAMVAGFSLVGRFGVPGAITSSLLAWTVCAALLVHSYVRPQQHLSP